MSYIGKKPTSSFASATSQTFTGNNSTTAFTLNRRVSAPEDLEVFVSNIQQQPTTSYTIGSTGLALNFDSAPPSGEFYVVYRSEAGTSAIDVGAARTANANTFPAAQTFSGGLSGTTSSFSGASTLTGGISNFTLVTGGVVQEYELSGTNYRSHSFLNSGPHRFSTSTSLTIDFLIVGGGGGSAPSEGNNGSTGGAGAGGLVEGTSQTLAPGNYAITVGAGGARSTSLYASGSNGGDSTFNGFTAKGGGGSGDYDTAGSAGGNGAGGSENQKAGGATTQDTYSGTTNVTGYGNAGGAGAAYPSGGAGSGGGAGGAGQGANNTNIAGGAGRANNFRTGNNITYAKGGSGATALRNSVVEGGANTGNGAGGVSKDGGGNMNSANGTAGIVVIRYAI